jgi:hypothetical protein
MQTVRGLRTRAPERCLPRCVAVGGQRSLAHPSPLPRSPGFGVRTLRPCVALGYSPTLSSLRLVPGNRVSCATRTAGPFPTLSWPRLPFFV